MGRTGPEIGGPVGQDGQETPGPVAWMAKKQEEQQARMGEQGDTTFRMVLSHVSQANSVRLLPWFLSTATNPCAVLIHSVSETHTTVMQPGADAPADDTTPEFESSEALESTGSPVCQASTPPPPALPIPDIPATGTPVGFPFFMLTINPKHKKWDCSPDSTHDDQCAKRAHTGSEEANISSGCSTPPVQPEFGNRVQPKIRNTETVPAASHSFDLPEPGLIDVPSSPVKGAADPDDGLAVEAMWSTRDCDRDSTMGISKDNANQGSDESDADSNSWECAADSSPDSASGNCLACLDTEEAAVKFAHKKFHKKVQASCSLTKWGILEKAQVGWIGDSHQTVCGSNYKVIKTEWDLTLNEDHSSFEVNKMMVQTD